MNLVGSELHLSKAATQKGIDKPSFSLSYLCVHRYTYIQNIHAHTHIFFLLFAPRNGLIPHDLEYTTCPDVQTETCLTSILSFPG